MGTNGHSINVQALADSKRLSASWLRDIGVTDLHGAIGITYFGHTGEELFQRRRTAGDRRFLQPKGVPLRLYGLWRGDVVRAAHAFLTEGESDAWAMWIEGLPALALPGSNTAAAIHAEDIADLSDLYLLPDNDAAGALFVEGVARRLRELRWNGHLWLLTVPSLYKDVSDWRVATGAAFKEGIADARRNRRRVDTPSSTPTAPSAPPQITDLANSRIFVEANASNLRYVFPWRRWAAFDGTRWMPDALGNAEESAKKTVAAMFDEAIADMADLKNEG